MLDNCFLFRVSIQLLKNIKMQKFISFTLNVRSSFCASVGLRKIRNKLFSMNPEENLSFLPSTKLDWSSTRLDYQQCTGMYMTSNLLLDKIKAKVCKIPFSTSRSANGTLPARKNAICISLRMWMRIFFTTS
jgi:hypothetical protein